MTAAFMSSAASPWQSRRSPSLALVAVLLAHLLLIGWMWRAHWGASREAQPPQIVSMFLQAFEPKHLPEATRPEPGNERRTGPVPKPAGAAPPAIGIAPSATQTAVQAATGKAITPEPAASAPLDLSLHGLPEGRKPGARDAALNDPRVTGHASYGERFAGTLGTDQRVREERIDDGLRVRQGTGCTELHDSRAATLDPYNQSYLPTPKAAKPCS